MIDIETQIVAAFAGYLPIAAGVYQGDDVTYLVYNYTEIPADYGDDDAGAVRYLIQIHLYAPVSDDTYNMRREIKSRINSAGFTRPTVTPASDAEKQHYVFECETAEGV